MTEQEFASLPDFGDDAYEASLPVQNAPASVATQASEQARKRKKKKKNAVNPRPANASTGDIPAHHDVSHHEAPSGADPSAATDSFVERIMGVQLAMEAIPDVANSSAEFAEAVYAATKVKMLAVGVTGAVAVLSALHAIEQMVRTLLEDDKDA